MSQSQYWDKAPTLSYHFINTNNNNNNNNNNKTSEWGQTGSGRWDGSAESLLSGGRDKPGLSRAGPNRLSAAGPVATNSHQDEWAPMPGNPGEGIV